LAANDPAPLRLRTPALIVQDGDDPISAAWRTDRVTRSLSARGAMVGDHVYPGIGHFDVIAAAHSHNAQWIDNRVAETAVRPEPGESSSPGPASGRRAEQWRTSTRGG